MNVFVNVKFAHVYPRTGYITCNYYVSSFCSEKYPEEFSGMFHALDMWHKSVKLAKKLGEVCKCAFANITARTYAKGQTIRYLSGRGE